MEEKPKRGWWTITPHRKSRCRPRQGRPGLKLFARPEGVILLRLFDSGVTFYFIFNKPRSAGQVMVYDSKHILGRWEERWSDGTKTCSYLNTAKARHLTYFTTYLSTQVPTYPSLAIRAYTMGGGRKEGDVCMSRSNLPASGLFYTPTHLLIAAKKKEPDHVGKLPRFTQIYVPAYLTTFKPRPSIDLPSDVAVRLFRTRAKRSEAKTVWLRYDWCAVEGRQVLLFLSQRSFVRTSSPLYRWLGDGTVDAVMRYISSERKGGV